MPEIKWGIVTRSGSMMVTMTGSHDKHHRRTSSRGYAPHHILRRVKVLHQARIFTQVVNQNNFHSDNKLALCSFFPEES